MKKYQKSIMSCFMALTMVMMSCFSCIFAATDGDSASKNAKAMRTTGSGIQTTKSGLEVYLIGDSTVCEYPEETVTKLDRQGWGMRLGDYFNEEVTIHNLAISGRSSRSFIVEDYYTELLNGLDEGDYLFIQFGHNDQKTDERGTKPGLDLNTLDAEGKNAEGTYSYEWFMIHKYIEPALERGAVPVLVSPITRRASSGGANYKDHVPYQEALEKLAKEYDLPYIDLMGQTRDIYTAAFQEGGAEATAALHAFKESNGELVTDNTHLSKKGATLVSGLVAESVKALGLQLADCIKSEEADTADEGITIHLAGDSTVKTYEEKTQFIGGWGEFIQNYFDGSKVTIRNYAEGGRSTRSFINEGRLIDNGKFTTSMTPAGMGPISESIKAGDYLFIQFGHNDDNSKGYSTMYDRMIPLGEPDANGIYPITPGVKTATDELPAAYLAELNKAGLTDEAKTAAINKALTAIQKYGETYYAYDCGGTYKWFLKQYIDFAREQGATPVLITPVSRRYFGEDGKIKSEPGHHGGSDEYCDFRYVEAVRQLAAEENVILIDLFAKTKDLYETLGEKDSSYMQSLKDAKGSRLDGIWISEYNDYIANGGYGAFDNTHQNKLGAHVFAGKLVEEILKNAAAQKDVNGKTESLADIAVAAYKVPVQYAEVPECLKGRLKDIAATFEIVKPFDEKLLEESKPEEDNKPGDDNASGDTDKPADDNTSNDTNKPSSGTSSSSKKHKVTVTTIKPEEVKNEEKAETAVQPSFKDLAGCDWAMQSINRFSALGFIKGMPDGTFLPKHNITRADFIMIGASILGLEGKASSNFKDVADNKYYADSIALMAQNGIVTGMADNSVSPEGNITRQDAMCIAARMLEKAGKLGESNQAVLETFKDQDSVSAYAKDSVAALVELKVISGADGKINPKAYMTRAEVCVMLEQVYDLLNQ